MGHDPFRTSEFTLMLDEEFIAKKRRAEEKKYQKKHGQKWGGK